MTAPVPPAPDAARQGRWRVASVPTPRGTAQAHVVGRMLTAATGRDVEVVAAVEPRAALAAGDAEVAVHSFEDLPPRATPGIALAAVPGRIDPRDALVSRDGWRLAAIPRDRLVTVGVTSSQRGAQLQRHRRDVVVQAVEGDLESELRRVADGALDALVVSVASLLWLRPVVPGVVVVPLEHGEVLHQAGQGAIAVECRTDDAQTRRTLSGLDDEGTRTEVTAERELWLQLEGADGTLVGAHAELMPASGGAARMELLGLLTDPSGTSLFRASHQHIAAEPKVLARAMAASLLEAGGQAVLERRRGRRRR